MNQTELDMLVDRNEIAHILGVGPTAVSNYVARTNSKHSPFPEPVLARSLGRFRLWDLEEVKQWHQAAFPSRVRLWDDTEGRLYEYRRSHGYD